MDPGHLGRRGLSTNRERAAYRISQWLHVELGKPIIPVHPRAETVHGAQGYASLADIPDQDVKVVDCFVELRARRCGRRRRHRAQGAARHRRDLDAGRRRRRGGRRAARGPPASTSSWTPARRSSGQAWRGHAALSRTFRPIPEPSLAGDVRAILEVPAPRSGAGCRSAAVRRSRSAAPLAWASSRRPARNAASAARSRAASSPSPGTEDARGEQAGVARPADRHRRDRHPRRHLDDREQRVHPVEVPQRHGHPDDRQRRDRGEHPRAGAPLRRPRRRAPAARAPPRVRP